MIVGMVVHRRHAARYREIVRIMLAHGLGGLVAPVGRFRRWTAADMNDSNASPETDEIRAHHLRLAFEELGPAFIKLGQILSTRIDVLPPVYIQELERLQDRIAPDDVRGVRRTIESELRAPINEIFAAFDSEPLAVASLGQVHAATLKDGRQVVVKVQRDGVAARASEDISILRQLAAAAERRSSFLRGMDLTGLVAEFAWTIRGELDFLHEARSSDRIRIALRDDQTIRIPEIHWSHSTSRVLTMERIDGIRIDQVDRLIESGHDPVVVARQIVQVLAFQILELGLFHADPHPGNIVVCGDGVIGMYDFGLVGAMDERLRERLLFLAMAIMERDSSRVVDEIATLGAAPMEWDRRAMERDVSHLLTQYVGVSLREVPVSTVLDDAMVMIRRYQLRLPVELALLAKTAMMTEALARRLDPGINVFAVGEPAIRRAGQRFYSPGFWMNRMKGRPLEVALLSAALPGHIQRFISRLDRNDFQVHVQVDDLPNVLYEMNSMVNRLVLSIIAAAVAIGTALLVLAIRPVWGSWEGWALLAIFMMAGALFFNVLFRVWRSGRR